eukprot:6115634-Pyramimonas_sp.AAC.1
MLESADAIRSMKDGKCKDSAGVVAEMLKHSGRKLREGILPLFNAVLHPDKEPPESRRPTRL